MSLPRLRRTAVCGGAVGFVLAAIVAACGGAADEGVPSEALEPRTPPLGARSNRAPPRRSPGPTPLVVARRSPGQPSALTFAPPAGELDPDRKARGRTAVSKPDDRKGPDVLRFAHEQLRWLAPLYGSSPRVELDAVGTWGRAGGPTVVTFEERRGGVPIWDASTAVLLRADGSLARVRGGPEPSRAVLGDFTRTHEQALATALSHQRPDWPAGSWKSQGVGSDGHPRYGWQLDAASGGGALVFPARVRPVYFGGNAGLVPAHEVVLATDQAGAGRRAETLVVDARQLDSAADSGQGAVLAARSLLHAHTYRVWTADAAGTPGESPQESLLPYPASVPSGVIPANRPSVLVEMDGFNSNPDGEADPWLAPDATTTRGNNVDAYVDFFNPNGLSSGEYRASVTSPGVFDHGYDLSQGPLASQEQSEAAIVQAFYTTNWLHDWYYDSGFTEARGNAQLDNFGRGGQAGDHLHVQVQDSAQLAQPEMNNANMATPPDGMSPVMQIYLFSAPSLVSIGLSPGGSRPAGTASFGPQTFDVTAEVAAAEPLDACQTLTASLTGRIALIRRGGTNCSFAQKVARAQTAGAVGVIIANNVAGETPFGMGPDGQTNPLLPVLSTTQSAGDGLLAALDRGSVTGSLLRSSGVERDGALDGTLVSHEFGHYLQERLSPCLPTLVADNGLSAGQCGAMHEGMSDFVALHMLFGEDDDPSLAYPLGGYAGRIAAWDAYFGLRRYPYSTSLDINPLTFRHIMKSAALPAGVLVNDQGVPNNEVHAAGEVWAAMLFDVYAALQEEAKKPGDARTFADVRRQMSDDLVLGVSMMPTARTFVEARDALLGAIAARRPSDAVVAAQAFARRGLGTCAVAPPFDSATHAGLTESFEVTPTVEIGVVLARDEGCDNGEDGVLDAGETGALAIELINRGYAPLTGAQVSIEGVPEEIELDGSTTVTVDSVPPQSSVWVEIPATLGADVEGILRGTVTVTVQTTEPCEAVPAVTLPLAANYDIEESSLDEFGTAESTWQAEGPEAPVIWTKTEDDGDALWHATNHDSDSNTALVSPPIQVSETEDFLLSFEHRFDFEVDQGITWDGAVIEVSEDDGITWRDAESYPGIDAGYTGSLRQENRIGNTVFRSFNPLVGLSATRPAYVGESPGYPARTETSIDFGAALAGKTIRIAFRVGTDIAEGAPGWDLYSVTVSGAEPSPFSTQVADSTKASACPEPSAPDPTEGSGGESGLPASPLGGASSSSQTGGSAALGPEATGGATDSGDPGAPGGCGCRTAAHSSNSGAAWLLALAVGWTLQRRRGKLGAKL